MIRQQPIKPNMSWPFFIQDLLGRIGQLPEGLEDTFIQVIERDTKLYFSPEDSQPYPALIFPIQKAFVHAFQLYNFESLRRLISNYSVVNKSDKTLKQHLNRSISSINLIPLLRNLTRKRDEINQLNGYQRLLENHLLKAFSCDREDIYDPSHLARLKKNIKDGLKFDSTMQEKLFQERLELLLAPAYRFYLILRNRYFSEHVLFCAHHEDRRLWIHRYLDQLGMIMELDLNRRIQLLDFRIMERLVKALNLYVPEDILILKNLPHGVEHSESEHALESFLDESEDFAAPTVPNPILLQPKITPPLKQSLSDAQPLPLAIVAKDAPESMNPAPLHAYQRDPFEEMCFRYAQFLIYLAQNAVTILDCNAPYFRPKHEEYNLEAVQELQDFFNDQLELMEDFTAFTRGLLEDTKAENPFKPLKDQVTKFSKKNGEWVPVEAKERNREWSLMVGSLIPFSSRLAAGPDNPPLRRGKKFILQIGFAYFDYDLPNFMKYQTHATGYFKLLLQGTVISSRSALVYVGQEAYYTATEKQLKQWKGLVLLTLITLRNKYNIDFSVDFKNFLVENLPKALEHSF